MKGPKSFTPYLGWLLFCNISIFAVTICILSGCRTTSQSSYSLINCDRQTLEIIFGEECGNTSVGLLPDTYKLGLSGVCKVQNGTTHCKKGPAQSLDVGKLILADISASNTTQGQNKTSQDCKSYIESKQVNHALVHQLTTVIFSLLLVSVTLNVTSLIIGIISGSAFGPAPFVPLLLDAIALAACIGLYFGIAERGLGDYMVDKNAALPSMHILGIGFWMLIAVFVVRVLSHPALAKGFICLLLLIPFGLIFLVCLVFSCTAALAPAYQVDFFYYSDS